MQKKKENKEMYILQEAGFSNSNASGYCAKCYRHSPNILNTKRIKQKEYYKETFLILLNIETRPDIQS